MSLYYQFAIPSRSILHQSLFQLPRPLAETVIFTAREPQFAPHNKQNLFKIFKKYEPTSHMIDKHDTTVSSTISLSSSAFLHLSHQIGCFNPFIYEIGLDNSYLTI